MNELRKNYIMFLIGFVTNAHTPFCSSHQELKEVTNNHIDMILYNTKQNELTTEEKNYFDMVDSWITSMTNDSSSS